MNKEQADAPATLGKRKKNKERKKRKIIRVPRIAITFFHDVSSQTLPHQQHQNNHQNQQPRNKIASSSLLLLIPLNTTIEVVDVIPPVPFWGPLNSPSQARGRSAGLRFGSRRRGGKILRPVSRHRKTDGRLLSRGGSRGDGGDRSGRRRKRRRRRR